MCYNSLWKGHREKVNKMTKVEKYLYKRIDSLSEEKVVLITKINKIAIEIEEVEQKMEEMSKDLDMAFEIFSPKPKKNDFNRNEIEKLGRRKEELINLRDEFVKQCMTVEEDIVEIRESLGEEFDEDLIYDIDEKKENTVVGLKILDEQEMEKQEFATKLNESTYSVLNNLIYKCDMCLKIVDVDTVRAKLELEIISKSLRDMQDNIQNIVYQLKPAEYKDIDLNVALERMINLYKISSDMKISYNIIGTKYKLSPVIEMSCLRIIHEATDNSVKYSEGKNITINLYYEDDSIKIEVLDDGKGIDFSNAISDKGEIVSLGLSLIRERAFLLGGDVDIISDTKGTKITVIVPLNM